MQNVGKIYGIPMSSLGGVPLIFEIAQQFISPYHFMIVTDIIKGYKCLVCKTEDFGQQQLQFIRQMIGYQCADVTQQNTVE